MKRNAQPLLERFLRVPAEILACVASISNRVIARKLERKRKTKRWKREGSFFPLPRHSFFFLLSRRDSDNPFVFPIYERAKLAARKRFFENWQY